MQDIIGKCLGSLIKSTGIPEVALIFHDNKKPSLGITEKPSLGITEKPPLGITEKYHLTLLQGPNLPPYK